MSPRAVLLTALVLAAAPAVQAQRPTARPLDATVSLTVRDGTLLAILLRLRDAGAPLAWRGDLLPDRRGISVAWRDVPLAQALDELLTGTGLLRRVSAGGTVVLVPAADSASATATISGSLATGIQALDQLVVTGSPVGPLPGREQPTAVTLVSRADLEGSPHRRMGDALRAFLPGLVLWDRGGIGPPPIPGGVRGVASFTARAPKLYVDGVEVASPELFTLLDLRGVERIEMIHGPQGAALYGPDALNGVVQLETWKGAPGRRAIQPRIDALAGGHDRALDGTSLWREGAVGSDLTTSAGSFALLGSLTRLGGETPLAEAWRMQAGGQWHAGPLRFEVNARAATHEGPIERRQPLVDAVAVRGLQPLEERGVGLRLHHQATARFSQSLTAGVHRISGSREPFRSPILPPRLPLGATNERAVRQSLRWAGMYAFERLIVSAGAEASRRTLDRSARQADGSADLSALYREALDARGAFVQGRLRLGRVVLIAGARTDRVSSVGREAATPWAATAGASWSVPIGTTTLRLRGAWGRALRPPEPGMSEMLAAGAIRQEPNPSLRPERQAGIELGGELHFASGAWLRATWFDQRADDLLQQVDLRRPSGTTRFYQFQNVGAITNRGVEIDGGVTVGRFSAAARVHLVSSRVAQLAPNYTGEFEAGDSPLEVPESLGSAAVRYDAGMARLEAGATWLGPWTGYDWRLVSRVELGQAPVRDRAREYWLEYDGVLRPFVGARIAIGSGVTAWGRAEWPAGRNALLRDNLSPALGRSLVVGVELRQR